jgi:hypothetical protein
MISSRSLTTSQMAEAAGYSKRLIITISASLRGNRSFHPLKCCISKVFHNNTLLTIPIDFVAPNLASVKVAGGSYYSLAKIRLPPLAAAERHQLRSTRPMSMLHQAMSSKHTCSALRTVIQLAACSILSLVLFVIWENCPTCTLDGQGTLCLRGSRFNDRVRVTRGFGNVRRSQ